ncbi:MAG: hypothetical protein PHY09_08160 [Desulfuromonadaceae bacterium]|nr:hypothetical protein [Desulfuromonadaceae bacterium]MDD5106296.1 hypothetical protein [Desulfuromonadaceae bacterium]
MKNEICKFTIAQSERIIGMALSVVRDSYYWLDSQKQYDLAMNVYCHLCIHNDCKRFPDPAYSVIQTLVHNRAENMRLIRRKSKAQRMLEKKLNRSTEENLQLDELASARAIKLVSYEGLVEEYGYTKELGYTEDVETQIINSDIERIYRILQNKPFALKVVALVRYGFEIKEIAGILDVCYHTVHYNLNGSVVTPLKPEFNVPAEELAAKYRAATLAAIPEPPPTEPAVPTLTRVEQFMFDFMSDFPFLSNPYRQKKRPEARR